MKNAKLTALTIENFKSFKESTRIELAPLTIIIGRNNSGKSSIIQSLLLLKQTLNNFDPNIMLKLEGLVDAFTLRELTFGWPEAAQEIKGPTITLEWTCEFDIKTEFNQTKNPETIDNLTKQLSGLKKIIDNTTQTVKTSMTLHTAEIDDTIIISDIQIKSLHSDLKEAIINFKWQTGKWKCYWQNNYEASHIKVNFDHFIPYPKASLGELKKGTKQRAIYSIYSIIFAKPLEALKKLLNEFHYLGANRQAPPSLFKPATTMLDDIGVNGELAAQLLHRRQADIVHFLPPLQFETEQIALPEPEKIYARPLVAAVNHVMESLSINAPLRVHEIEGVGFQLLFGKASLPHVGRGLNALLPMIELGLLADPLRFTGLGTDNMDLSLYQIHCDTYSHIGLEESESHLHPKVASYLAHWLVSLARSNRRLLVETHSDHLVRRLRGLVVRAANGSELEQWLLENVVILNVEQDAAGISTINTSYLTIEGGFKEQWPEDFMDEAMDEENEIYYAKLNKVKSDTSEIMYEVIEGDEPSPEESP